MNLTESLAVHGITHKRDDHTAADQKHSWFDHAGKLIGRYDVHEGWEKLKEIEAESAAEWSGSPDPEDPDNFWIDDKTGERVCAHTGARTHAAEQSS